MKKRIFCLLLAFCVVSTLFLGCRKAPTDPDETTFASAEQETTDAPSPTGNAGFSEEGPQDPSQETTEASQASEPSNGSSQSGTPEQTDPVDGSEETTEPKTPSSSQDTPSLEQPKPEETPADTTAPETPEQTQPAHPAQLSYEEYLALDAYGKQDYFMSFPDWNSFFSWQERAIEEYEKTHSSVDADGVITLPVAP